MIFEKYRTSRNNEPEPQSQDNPPKEDKEQLKKSPDAELCDNLAKVIEEYGKTIEAERIILSRLNELATRKTKYTKINQKIEKMREDMQNKIKKDKMKPNGTNGYKTHFVRSF